MATAITSLGSSSGTNGTSQTHNTTGAVPSGALVVAVVGLAQSGSTAITVSGGGLTWTKDKEVIGTDEGANYRLAVFSAPAPSGLASGTTITATCSGLFGTILTLGYLTGVDTGASRVDGTPVGQFRASPNTTWSSTGLTTGNAADALLTAALADGGPQSSTAGGSFTETTDVAAFGVADMTVAFRDVTSTGTYTGTGTWNTTPSTDMALLVAYKAAGGAAVTGSASFDLTVDIASAGKRGRKGASGNPYLFSIDSVGKRGRKGASVTDLSLGITSAGTRVWTGAASLGLTFDISSAPFTSAVTGAASLGLTFGFTSAGKRSRKGASDTGLTFSVTSAGTRVWTGASDLGLSLSISSAGIRGRNASAAIDLTFDVSSVGKVGYHGAASLSLVVEFFSRAEGAGLFLDVVTEATETLTPASEGSLTLSTPASEGSLTLGASASEGSLTLGVPAEDSLDLTALTEQNT